MHGVFECRARSLAELVKLQFTYVHVFEHSLARWRGFQNDHVHGFRSIDELGEIASPSTVAATWNLHKLPFAQFGDESSLIDRFRMYSGPTRLSNLNGWFRERRPLCSESSRSAASLERSLTVAAPLSAQGHLLPLTEDTFCGRSWCRTDW